MPRPGPNLFVHKISPLNAEPPLDRLRAHFITPVERFYIRTHGSIPHAAGRHERLQVHGRVTRPCALSLRELRNRFPRRTVVATLQCAGNRRSELAAVRPVAGTPWQPGSIGTAEWSGVPLAEVLHAAGCADPDAPMHVAFAADDLVEREGRRLTYGASIPLAKALRPEVLLADRMNGRPLPVEHGGPLRVVVPGYVGARSVKWLTAIDVRDQPSDNYFQQTDYKLYPPDMAPDRLDPDAGTTLYETPVNAAICEPGCDATVAAGAVEVRGYALAGCRAVERIDVTADGGRSWARAAFERPKAAPWAWTFWQAHLTLPPGRHELAVRAVDSEAQAQPALPSEVWNPKGYVNNAWHRVPVLAC